MGNSNTSTDTSETKFIKTTIAQNCIVLFVKDSCPFSQDALELFQNLKVPFCSVSLNRRPDMDKLQDTLGEMTGAKTVPRVFINGKFVGGAEDTIQLMEDGKLMGLIKECAEDIMKSPCNSDRGDNKRY